MEIARASIKRRGETTDEATRSIVCNELLTLPATVAHLLPNRTTLARDVQRHRQAAGTSDQGDVSDYCQTQSGHPFLRIRTDAMLIFADDEDLQFLARCDH